MATKSKPLPAPEPKSLACGELASAEKVIANHLAFVRVKFWSLNPPPSKEECAQFNAAIDQARALLSARCNQVGRTE